MTKSEAIKAAYGEFWEKVKDYVDENGWCTHPDKNEMFPEIDNLLDSGYVSLWENTDKWMPTSLNIIIDNNGWTVLNKDTYDNLDNSYYMWYNINNGDWEVGDLDESFLQEYTHFQEIKLPPKPPIF